MGATTDISYDVQMGCMDDAWTVAMTDEMHSVWTDCTDDAQTGAPKRVMYDVLTDGYFTGFSCRLFTAFFSL